MNIPVIHCRKSDPPALCLAKEIIRRILYIPVSIRALLDKTYPWLNHGAVNWLRSNLTPEMIGYEWGSGRSTVFFARFMKRLVSLEHKKKWFRRVQGLMAECGVTNVDYYLIPPVEEPSQSSAVRPHIWDDLKYTPRKPEFTAYFDHILRYPDESFDAVLVDGRARVECALNALNKIKPGGFLILDNSEWEKYRPIFQVVTSWGRLVFENGVWQTTIFQKPGGVLSQNTRSNRAKDSVAEESSETREMRRSIGHGGQSNLGFGISDLGIKELVNW